MNCLPSNRVLQDEDVICPPCVRLTSFTWWVFLGLLCFSQLFYFRVSYWTQTEEQKLGRPGNEATRLPECDQSIASVSKSLSILCLSFSEYCSHPGTMTLTAMLLLFTTVARCLSSCDDHQRWRLHAAVGWYPLRSAEWELLEIRYSDSERTFIAAGLLVIVWQVKRLEAIVISDTCEVPVAAAVSATWCGPCWKVKSIYTTSYCSFGNKLTQWILPGEIYIDSYSSSLYVKCFFGNPQENSAHHELNAIAADVELTWQYPLSEFCSN